MDTLLELAQETVATQRAELARLRHDRLDCQVVMDGQQAEIEMLRAALKPFAELAGKLKDAPNLVGILTEDDFQRARDAIPEQKAGDQT